MQRIQKRLPVEGQEDFKYLIENNKYYVDKTLIVRDILKKGDKVSIFIRPRRWGKTLTMSMLRHFFSNEEGNNPKELFAGLKIMECGDKVFSQMGQYPVIFLTMKEMKSSTLNLNMVSLRSTIASAYLPHRSILKDLSPARKKQFNAFMDRTAGEDDYADALGFLCECLTLVYGKKVIIFIDEYDVPFNTAFDNKGVEKLLEIVRAMYSSALKTNENLEFGVLTGCLKIAKDSMYSCLNNPAVYSVTSNDYTDSFGFTEEEVTTMFDAYGFHDNLPTAMNSYDGYTIGGVRLLTPLSALDYLSELLVKPDVEPKNYWSLSGSADYICAICEKVMDTETRENLSKLEKGETIETELDDDLYYAKIFSSPFAIFTNLLYGGYLTVVSGPDKNGVYRLRVPNKEVLETYQRTIHTYLENNVYHIDDVFLNAFIHQDVDTLEKELTIRLQRSLSVRDQNDHEAPYHNFMTGLLSSLPRSLYKATSQRESGDGYPDFVVEDIDSTKAFVIEFKNAGLAKYNGNRVLAAQDALQQCHAKHYALPFEMNGEDITLYGFGFFQKGVRVLMEHPGKKGTPENPLT